MLLIGQINRELLLNNVFNCEIEKLANIIELAAQYRESTPERQPQRTTSARKHSCNKVPIESF